MSCSISVCADWGWGRSTLCILMLKIVTVTERTSMIYETKRE